MFLYNYFVAEKLFAYKYTRLGGKVIIVSLVQMHPHTYKLLSTLSVRYTSIILLATCSTFDSQITLLSTLRERDKRESERKRERVILQT